MIQQFNALIQWATTQQASDIHLSADNPLWLRCLGSMQMYPEWQFSTEALTQIFSVILNEKQQVLLQKQHYIDRCCL